MSAKKEIIGYEPQETGEIRAGWSAYICPEKGCDMTVTAPTKGQGPQCPNPFCKRKMIKQPN